MIHSKHVVRYSTLEFNLLQSGQCLSQKSQGLNKSLLQQSPDLILYALLIHGTLLPRDWLNKNELGDQCTHGSPAIFLFACFNSNVLYSAHLFSFALDGLLY